MTRKFTVPIELPEVAATPTTPASGSAALYAKTDGLPYWLGDDGVERPFFATPPAALHTNPGLEGTWFTSSNGTATVVGPCPPNYTLFWCSDGVTSAQETVDKTEGLYAFRLNKIAGAGKNARLHSGTVFSVTPGDTITVSIDAKCDVGATFYVGLLSASTQAGCDFFTGDPLLTSSYSSFTMIAGAAYRRCTGTFTVPPGCYWSRVTFHYDTTGDVAGVLRLDNSASSRTIATAGVVDPVHTRRTMNVTQSIANGTTTLMTFNTLADNLGGITYAGGTFTVPVAGRYYCSFGVAWNENAAGRRTVLIGKNGTSSVATQDLIPHSSINHTNDLSITVDLVAGDTIGFYLYQASGVALATTGNPDRSFGAITLVGGPKGETGPVGPAGPPSSVVVPQRQVFTASGTWTKPAGFVYAEVEVQGGGGGGSGAANPSATLANVGGSGGGGGFTRKLWLDAQLSATENVVVGTGGTSGPANDTGGGAGNPSSFKTTQIGNGGGGGAASGASSLARGAGGAGGSGSGGDYTIVGGDGPSGAVIANAGGTAPSTQAINGGTSFFSGAARSGSSAASGNGPAGQPYGGGGVGGHSRANSGAVTGGAGGAGIVIVTSYCTT